MTTPELLEESRKGWCFMLTGTALVEGKFPASAQVVHGLITVRINGTVRTIHHAWIEYDRQAWEPVLDQRYPVGSYYEEFRAVALSRYNRFEAAAHVLAARNWGPWI